MNEMKQLQMRLTSDNKLVCDSNPIIVFCDGKRPYKDEPVLTFEQEDVVYLTDYEGWTSQYEEAMKIVKERRCCAIVTDNPMLLNILAPYVWNGEDFDCYMYYYKLVIEDDKLKFTPTYKRFSELTDKELRYAHKLGTMYTNGEFRNW